MEIRALVIRKKSPAQRVLQVPVWQLGVVSIATDSKQWPWLGFCQNRTSLIALWLDTFILCLLNISFLTRTLVQGSSLSGTTINKKLHCVAFRDYISHVLHPLRSHGTNVNIQLATPHNKCILIKWLIQWYRLMWGGGAKRGAHHVLLHWKLNLS